jgi:hypothetical protein
MYDAMREEKLYQDVMTTQYWRALLAIACGLAFVLITLLTRRAGALKD